MNRSKAKGTKAEGEVLRWLDGITWAELHRNVLHGPKDIGDIGGLKDMWGNPIVIEVKSGQPDLKSWLAELDAEVVNAAATYGFVVWRTPGTTDPDRWVVFSRLDTSARLYPRLPLACKQTAIPAALRRLAGWSSWPTVGINSDGTIPTSRTTADCVAMLGGQFESWLHLFSAPWPAAGVAS